MRRIALAIICISLVSGCRDPQPVAENSATPHAHEQAEVYGMKLIQLRDQARGLEAELKFSKAAEVWNEIRGQIRSDFGDNSWQEINARIAHKAAIRNDLLLQEHRQELKKIAAIETQIRTAYERKQIQLALDLSQQLLELQQPLFGDVSMETARLQLQIGTMQHQLGQMKRALKNLHAGIEIFRSKGIELHPELEISLAKLAEIYSRQQKYRPAVANQKAATQISGHIWGTDSLQYASQANQLGVIFHRAGNDSVAFKILNTAKAIREDKQGKNSLDYAHSCLNLGIVSLSQQKLDEAQQYLDDARKLFVAQLGIANEYSIRANAQLATIMMLRNRPDVAEQLLNEVLQNAGGRVSTDRKLEYQYKLAIAMARQGRYARSEPLLQEVLGRQNTLYGATSQQSTSTMKALARLFEATHQKDKLAAIRKQLNQTARVAGGNDFQGRY